jgi:hypothetical protein
MIGRRLAFLVLAAGFAATTGLLARAGDEKPALPEPPTTPEPAFDNPLADAKVGETLLYRTRDLESKKRDRFFEERVLALTKDQALVETVECDETGARIFGVDNHPTASGWRSRKEKLEDTAHQKWVTAKTKKEILYVGDPPTAAVRTSHRWLDEPRDFSMPEGPRRERQIWFSHDVPATGRVKMYPAQGGGERMVVSWKKVLTPEECAARAARYADPSGDKGHGAATSSPPGGAEPAGMDEPGMGEPEKPEPGMDEPAMGG